MRKNVLSLAVAGALFMAPAAVFAENQVYGELHLALDFVDGDEGDLKSYFSTVGVKGKHDLGDSGTSVIYKVEFQIDPTIRDKKITDRDQWLGLKGGFGKVTFGSITSNYKGTGKYDAMWKTAFEGRGFMNIQSNLHKGANNERGRLTNSIQYTAPKMGAMTFVGNITMDSNANETYGAGIRYKTKEFQFSADHFHPGEVGEDAFKVGGSMKMGAMTIAGMYEMTEDVVGYDYMLGALTYKMSKKNTLKFTAGSAMSDTKEENVSFAGLIEHKLGKKTKVYVGYGIRDNDDSDSVDVLSFGIRHKY